jgi:hypothetical protein
MDKLKSSLLWAQEVFSAVRGRAAAASEADEWVVRMIEHYVARIKREAFVAGADRYKNRLLSLAPREDQLRIKNVPLLPPGPTPDDIFVGMDYATTSGRLLPPRISSDSPAAITAVTPAMTKA